MRSNSSDSRKAKAMLTLTRVLVYLFLGILTLLFNYIERKLNYFK